MDINNKLARNILRAFAIAVLSFYTVFRISIPLINKEPIYLDKNDGYILLGCIALLLTIEAVRAFIQKILKNDKI